MRLHASILTIIFAASFFSCNSKQKKQNISGIDKASQSKSIIHSVDSADESKNCDCTAEFNLSDSNKLTRIKNEFYKSKTGHLYERTTGLKEVNGHLADNEYFNGVISQEIDPLSFEPLKGWYAKDKNNVYYYRPVSGGMQILKIDSADTKTFTLLAGHYKYGVDKKFFYDETEIIDGFNPGKTNLKLDNKGRVIEMINHKRVYKFELVN